MKQRHPHVKTWSYRRGFGFHFFVYPERYQLTPAGHYAVAAVLGGLMDEARTRLRRSRMLATWGKRGGGVDRMPTRHFTATEVQSWAAQLFTVGLNPESWDETAEYRAMENARAEWEMGRCALKRTATPCPGARASSLTTPICRA